MEKIINFTGPTIKRKDKNIKQNTYLSEQSEQSSNDEDGEALSPIYKKKSHFGGKQSPLPTSDQFSFKLKAGLDFTNIEQNFDTDESETNTPKNLQDNFSKGASKNIHSKFRSNTQTLAEEAGKLLKNQKNNIKGDQDGNPQDEEDILEEKNALKAAAAHFKEDNELKLNLDKKDINIIEKKEPSARLKKDHKARFMTQINPNVNSDNECKNVESKAEKAKSINNHPYRMLIFAPGLTESTLKKHISITYRGLVYSVKCLKGPSDKYIKTKQVSLIESKIPKKKTLLLDLDETLIHSCNLKENPQHILTATNEFGEKVSLGINIRPFCIEFLKLMSDYYDVFIFTASSPNYANTIINYIDPMGKYINGILTRSNCMETKNGFFIKDLRIIKNRELKNMIIVDNLAHSFGFQIENGIPILEWHNDVKDCELKYLCDYLIEASTCEDVRIFNKERLRLRDMADFKTEELGI